MADRERCHAKTGSDSMWTESFIHRLVYIWAGVIARGCETALQAPSGEGNTLDAIRIYAIRIAGLKEPP